MIPEAPPGKVRPDGQGIGWSGWLAGLGLALRAANERDKKKGSTGTIDAKIVDVCTTAIETVLSENLSGRVGWFPGVSPKRWKLQSSLTHVSILKTDLWPRTGLPVPDSDAVGVTCPS